jgi:hypothetical protein
MIKIISLFLALSSIGFADEMPIENFLPNHGQDCIQTASFGAIHKCGAVAYKSFTCSQVQYLVVGRMGSDTVPDCSPTFVVKEVLQQN